MAIVPRPEQGYNDVLPRVTKGEDNGTAAVGIPALPPSFVYGDVPSGRFFPADNTEEAAPGSTYRIIYHLNLPFLEEYQTSLFLSKLINDERFKIRYLALHEEVSQIVVIVTVIKPMSVPLLVAGAILAVAIGISVWITTSSIEKLGTVDLGDGAKFNLTPILLGGGILIALSALTRKR